MPETISIGWPSASRARSNACLRRAMRSALCRRPHAARVHVAQPLTEALEAAQGARRGLLVDPAILAHAGAEAHHLAQAVDDDELAVAVAGHDEMETIGSEIDRRQNLGYGARRPAHRGAQAVKEEPQPQVVCAL
jgi:hypothetical protein